MNEENEEKKDAVVCAHCGSVIDVDGGETFVETYDGDINGKWKEWCDSQYGIKVAAM